VNLIQAVTLGVVEGVTEYLPISSTGHLILASALLGLSEPPELKRAVDAYSIVIQGGAIMAVLILYWRRVGAMIRGAVGRDRAGLRLLINIVLACLPATVLGIILNDWIERTLFFPAPVLAALAIGGAAMLIVGRWQRRHFGLGDPAHPYVEIDQLTWRSALAIGLIQCLSLWPGTSRSMVTIIGGMICGMRPRQAAEFSFLLGLPTLGGACLYRAAGLLREPDGTTIELLGGPLNIIAGVVVAAVVAALAIEFLLTYLARHGLVLFGWYRLVFASILGVLIGQGWVEIGPSAADAPQ
jgi:undecaprenyl-diphosphatase